MRICVETKDNKCYFYKFDGRQFSKARRIIRDAFGNDIRVVWSYTGLSRGTHGVFQGIEKIAL